jgi:hypothetical protein
MAATSSPQNYYYFGSLWSLLLLRVTVVISLLPYDKQFSHVSSPDVLAREATRGVAIDRKHQPSGVVRQFGARGKRLLRHPLLCTIEHTHFIFSGVLAPP